MHTAIRLFGTQSCHLCAEAKAILHVAGVEAEYIDIIDDDRLLELYGMRIPVLLRMDSGAELGWPFDAMDVSRFLGS
jgi:Glutaredoxin-like domain (DUF836)